MELVPSPEPAGMADSNVTSIPVPNAFNCASSESKCSVEKFGWKPAKVSAAFGMENGEPTLL